MKDWKYHYEAAERLLERAAQPENPTDVAALYASMAAAHSNLALLEHEVQDTTELRPSEVNAYTTVYGNTLSEEARTALLTGLLAPKYAAGLLSTKSKS